MKISSLRSRLVLLAALLAMPIAGFVAGCASDGITGSVSYSYGYYDSWGWGGGYYDRPIIIGPPRPPVRPVPLPQPVPMPRRR